MVDLSQTEVDACVNIVNCAQSPWHAMLSNIYSLPQSLENMMTSAQPNDDVIFNAIKCKTRVANFQLLPSWPTPCPVPLFHSQIQCHAMVTKEIWATLISSRTQHYFPGKY